MFCHCPGPYSLVPQIKKLADHLDSAIQSNLQNLNVAFGQEDLKITITFFKVATKGCCDLD